MNRVIASFFSLLITSCGIEGPDRTTEDSRHPTSTTSLALNATETMIPTLRTASGATLPAAALAYVRRGVHEGRSIIVGFEKGSNRYHVWRANENPATAFCDGYLENNTGAPIASTILQNALVGNTRSPMSAGIVALQKGVNGWVYSYRLDNCQTEQRLRPSGEGTLRNATGASVPVDGLTDSALLTFDASGRQHLMVQQGGVSEPGWRYIYDAGNLQLLNHGPTLRNGTSAMIWPSSLLTSAKGRLQTASGATEDVIVSLQRGGNGWFYVHKFGGALLGDGPLADKDGHPVPIDSMRFALVADFGGSASSVLGAGRSPGRLLGWRLEDLLQGNRIARYDDTLRNGTDDTVLVDSLAMARARRDPRFGFDTLQVYQGAPAGWQYVWDIAGALFLSTSNLTAAPNVATEPPLPRGRRIGCPGADALRNTEVNANGELYWCILGAPPEATVELAPGRYRMDWGLEVTNAVTVTTKGSQGQRKCDHRGSHNCAELRAGPWLETSVLKLVSPSIAIDHIVIDGRKSDRPSHVNRCWSDAPVPETARNLMANAEMWRCHGCSVKASVSRNAICSTGFLVSDSDFVNIVGSTFSDNGIHAGEEAKLWADGLSVHTSYGTKIHNNLFVDNTDYDLILGGIRSGAVTNNLVQHISGEQARNAFGGIALFVWGIAPPAGDYQGTVIRDNVVDCRGNFGCGHGIAINGNVWYAPSMGPGARANVTNVDFGFNTVKGARTGLYIGSDATGITVGNFDVDGSNGRARCRTAMGMRDMHALTIAHGAGVTWTSSWIDHTDFVVDDYIKNPPAVIDGPPCSIIP